MRYHLTPVRIVIIIKSMNNRCWKECRKKGTLLHSWWEYKLVYPLETQYRECSKRENGDFVGGALFKNPPVNSGDTGSIPGLGRSPRTTTMSLSWSLWATTTEPMSLEPMFHNRRSLRALQLESSPHSPQRAKACLQQWRPCTAVNK